MGSTDIDMSYVNGLEYCKGYKRLKILPANDQTKELQTILRDKNTTRSDFKFYADRLIRLVIEESLNQLPFTECNVITPTSATYNGLKYKSGNCGVSIVRSGESMEQGLRDCCRSIRIGKILVESDAETHEARVVYARFPEDISRRHVLLMYPIMSTGNTVSKAVNVLKEHGVKEDCVILSNLFCTPQAVQTILDSYPRDPESASPPEKKSKKNQDLDQPFLEDTQILTTQYFPAELSDIPIVIINKEKITYDADSRSTSKQTLHQPLEDLCNTSNATTETKSSSDSSSVSSALKLHERSHLSSFDLKSFLYRGDRGRL